MDTKKLICKETEDELVEKIIRYAEEHGLTAGNIKEAVNRALKYMEDNAVLKKEPHIDCTTQIL